MNLHQFDNHHDTEYFAGVEDARRSLADKRLRNSVPQGVQRGRTLLPDFSDEDVHRRAVDGEKRR
jgi:hypothetical protein